MHNWVKNSLSTTLVTHKDRIIKMIEGYRKSREIITVLDPIIGNLFESDIDVLLYSLSIIFGILEHQTIIEENHDQLIDIFAVHPISGATIIQFVQK